MYKTLVNNGKSTNLDWLAPDFWTINSIQGFFDWFVLLGAIWLLYLYLCLTFQASQACHSIHRWPKSSLDSSCLTSSTTRQRSSSRCTTTRSPSALPGRWRSANVWVRAWNSCWPRNGLRHWGKRHMQSLRRQWRTEMDWAKSDGFGTHPHQRSRDRNSQDSQDHLTVAVKRKTQAVVGFPSKINSFESSLSMGIHFELLHMCYFGCVVHLEKLPSLMIPRKTKKNRLALFQGSFKKKRGETCDFQDVSVRLVIYKLFQPSSGCHPLTRGSKRWGCSMAASLQVSRLHPHGQEFIENDIFFLNILWYLVLFVMMKWVSGVVFGKTWQETILFKNLIIYIQYPTSTLSFWGQLVKSWTSRAGSMSKAWSCNPGPMSPTDSGTGM